MCAFCIHAGILKHGLSVGKAYLSDITGLTDRQAVLGNFSACSSLGFIVGPLLAGYFADRDESLQLCMMCGAGLFSLNMIFVLVLVKSVPSTKASVRAEDVKEMMTWKHFLSSMNIFKGIKWWQMYDLIALKFIGSLSVQMFRTNIAILIQDRFDADYTTLGKIMSFNGVSSAITAATCGYVSRLYSNPMKQVTHLLILLSLALLGATCAPNLLVFVAMIIPQTIATSNLRVCTTNLFLSRVSDEEKGEVIGMTYSITSVSRMLSPTFVGVAQEWSSLLPAYVSAGLASSAAIAMVTHSVYNRKAVKSQVA